MTQSNSAHLDQVFLLFGHLHAVYREQLCTPAPNSITHLSAQHAITSLEKHWAATNQHSCLLLPS